MKTKIAALAAACVGLFLGGLVAGYFVRPWIAAGLERVTLRPTSSPDATPPEDHAHEGADRDRGHNASEKGHEEEGHEEEHEHDHLPITRQGFENLGLKVGRIELSEYVKQLKVPAVVVEMPGRSDHALASPVNGIVTRVYALPGQAVNPGDALFDLQVTDEQLVDAQLKLLETLTRMEVVSTEMERLDPLAKSGTVPGRRRLELEYEQKQLESQKQVRLQELYLRGLDSDQIQSIVSARKLVQDLTVRLPSADGTQVGEASRPTEPGGSGGPVSPGGAGDEPPVRPVSNVDTDRGSIGLHYTLESLEVFPGRTVERGEDLCHLAHHAELYIQGQAFENDIEPIVQASKQGWTMTAEFGIEGHEIERDGLQLHYIDNHVDPETRSFLFYIPLRNEILQNHVDARGRRFISWRFKPGQRAHLEIPLERLRDQIQLPLAAIVEEGAEVYAFRALQPTPHEAEEGLYLEFEKVPVHVLERDTQWAVIANDGQLKVGDEVAMNQAYQLHLALKVQAGGGGGHHHDH